MSLDVSLIQTQSTEVFSSSITHNLNIMARAAGIYEYLWRPEELGIIKAYQLIIPLTNGLATLKASPNTYKMYSIPNNWGTYEQFIPWLETYIQACKATPNADVIASWQE